MPTNKVAELITTAERLSPERSPDQAIEVNQQILQLDPTNAAAQVRLARAYQAQRKFVLLSDIDNNRGSSHRSKGCFFSPLAG